MMNILSQKLMSEKDESDEEQELLVKTRPKTNGHLYTKYY